MKRSWWIATIVAGVVLALSSAQSSGLPELTRISLSLGALSLAGLVMTAVFPDVARDTRLAWRRRRRRKSVKSVMLRDESRLRVFWRVAVDFDGAGWARRELESLRLVVRNVEIWRPISPRLAARLAPNVHRVLADVLDRADDMARCGTELDLDPGAVETIERGVEELAIQLGEGRCVAGKTLPFDARSVVLGVDLLLDGCTRLLDAVRPAIACEPLTLLSGLARRMTSGARSVEIDAASVSALGRVGVRGRDLGESLAALIAADGNRAGLDVSIHGEARPSRVRLHLAWRAADGAAAPPPPRPEDALRALSCYGVRWSSSEESGSVTLSLPRYEPSPAPREPARAHGAVSWSGPRRARDGTTR